MTRQRRSRRPAGSGGDTFAVTSLSALGEYVRHRPESILGVTASETNRQEVESLLRGTDVSVITGRPQGGVVEARVRHRLGDVDDFLERVSGSDAPKRDLVLALDHIQDPRNLGAIIRTAAYFGVENVLAPTRRQVLLTPAVIDTAQGGFALTELVAVVNLTRTLRQLKELGYWILGAAMDGEPVGTVTGTYEKSVLVLGNEESGLARMVRETCDRLVAIEGRPGGLDSLNVSVAAGILTSAFAVLDRTDNALT